jgi:hypothetical protein
MSDKIARVTPREIAEMIVNEQAYAATRFVLADAHDAEIARLRALVEASDVLAQPGALTVNCVRGTVACQEAERLRAERDTLLLDARDFLRWFNRNYPVYIVRPSSHPDHPWCAINLRLNAHADTLSALDSGLGAEP